MLTIGSPFEVDDTNVGRRMILSRRVYFAFILVSNDAYLEFSRSWAHGDGDGLARCAMMDKRKVDPLVIVVSWGALKFFVETLDCFAQIVANAIFAPTKSKVRVHRSESGSFTVQNLTIRLNADRLRLTSQGVVLFFVKREGPRRRRGPLMARQKFS